MEENVISKRLEVIEQRLEGRQSKMKDAWDKFNIVASLLIPATIALSGYFFSRAVTNAQLASAEKLAIQNQANADAKTLIEQAQLLATFMEPLVSDSAQKQKLAIEA